MNYQITTYRYNFIFVSQFVLRIVDLANWSAVKRNVCRVAAIINMPTKHPREPATSAQITVTC